MLRRLRISNPALTYFTSDPHFNHNHPQILAKAGAKDAADLNRIRMEAWNAAIPPDADVFMLGDFCLHDPDGRTSREMLRNLNGRRKYLVWGNHNSGLKMLYRQALARQIFPDKPAHANNYEVYPLKTTVGKDRDVIFLGSYAELLWKQGRQDLKIILHHYAMRTWLHAHRGAWMLCGHSHGNDRPIAELGDVGLGKILEVGFDAIGKPRNLLELQAIMESKPTRSDHRAANDLDEDDDD